MTSDVGGRTESSGLAGVPVLGPAQECSSGFDRASAKSLDDRLLRTIRLAEAHHLI